MKVISVFSGAGGLDLGFLRAGHEIVWANDDDPEAVETYRRNIGSHIVLGDIRSIKTSDIPNGDILIGGFPCQGFSVANWKRSITDPRNLLFREASRVLKGKQPSFFVMENVSGLTSMANGKALQMICDEFSSVGYKVRNAVLNAADYGVPQRRLRLILLGVRSDLKVEVSFPPPPTHSEPGILPILGLKPWTTVGEALAHFPEPDNENTIPNHECSRYKLKFNGHLGHRVIDPKRPAPTVTARGDKNGGVVVLHHPGNHRRMSARELAAVQSFPDDFVFAGPKTSAYRQIGNSVPPLLAEAIAKVFEPSKPL